MKFRLDLENMSVDVRTDVDFLIFTEGTGVLNQ